MNEGENVRISDGILLVRSKSGTSKIHKVIVHTKPGRRKSYVKWFEELVKKKKKPPSRIPVFVRNYRRKYENIKNIRSSTTIVTRSTVWNDRSRSPQMRSKLSISVPCRETNVEIIYPPESSEIFANEEPEINNNREKKRKQDSGVDSFLSQTDSSEKVPSRAKLPKHFEEDSKEDLETEEKTSEEFKIDTSAKSSVQFPTDTQVEEDREDHSETQEESSEEVEIHETKFETDTQIEESRKDNSEPQGKTSEEIQVYKSSSEAKKSETDTQIEDHEDDSEPQGKTSKEFQVYKSPSEAKKSETDTQIEDHENDSEPQGKTSEEFQVYKSPSEAKKSETDTQIENHEDDSEPQGKTSEEFQVYKSPSEAKKSETDTQIKEGKNITTEDFDTQEPIKIYTSSEVKIPTQFETDAQIEEDQNYSEEFQVHKSSSRQFQTEEDSETQDEEFKIHTPSHSTASFLLDNETLISPSSLKSECTSQQTDPILEEEFDDNEGEACVDEVMELRDRIETFQKPEFLEIKHTTLVMAQFESTIPDSPLVGDASKPPPETFEELEISESSESVIVRRYIDSGLRPHRSDESRLYLDAYIYRKKKLRTVTNGDEVEPLLEEIPSSIFPKRKKRKKPKEVKTEPTPVESPVSDKSIVSEPLKIDSEQLNKLKEFEDVTYLIKTDDEKEPIDDFCVHVKDVSDDKFSSSSVGWKEEVCIHTRDPPGISEYSPDSSSVPTIPVVAPTGEICSVKRKRPRTPQKCVCFEQKTRTTGTTTEGAEYSESSAPSRCTIPLWKYLKLAKSFTKVEFKPSPTPKKEEKEFKTEEKEFVRKPKHISRTVIDISTCDCKNRKLKRKKVSVVPVSSRQDEKLETPKNQELKREEFSVGPVEFRQDEKLETPKNRELKRKEVSEVPLEFKQDEKLNTPDEIFAKESEQIAHEPTIEPVVHPVDQSAVQRVDQSATHPVDRSAVKDHRYRAISKMRLPSSSESPSSASSNSHHKVKYLLLESNKERRRSKFQHLERKESTFPNSSDLTDFKRWSFSSRSLTPSSTSLIPQKPKQKRIRSKSQKAKKKNELSSKSTSSDNKD